MLLLKALATASMLTGIIPGKNGKYSGDSATTLGDTELILTAFFNSIAAPRTKPSIAAF
jgi:hypothetical protein